MKTLPKEIGAKVGEEYTVSQYGAKQPIVILKSCEKNMGGRWFCITHNIGFPSNLAADIHMEHGTHVTAWLCFEHGYESHD